MKRATKAHMIDAMAALLQKQGFHASSINQLIRDSGVPKGSVYFHFPGGKEELVCAALDRAAHTWHQRLEQAVAGARSPGEVIAAVCETLTQVLVASNYAQGCPLTTVALEAASASARVQETCAQHYASCSELIAHTLHSVGMPRDRAHGLANMLLSMLEGAQVLCRVQRSTAPLARIAGDLDALVAGAS